MTKNKGSKRPNTTTLSNPATISSTSQPADILRDDVHALATTRLSFSNFVNIATTENIKKFLKQAATTLEGENLLRLWERAYDDGYKNGKKSLLRSLEENLEESYEKGVERGMNLGREEGFTVASEGFRRALASKKANTTDTGTQADPPNISTASIHTQTSSPITVLNATTSRFTQTDPDDYQNPPTTTSTSVYTQTTSQTISTSPSPSPASATSPPSLSTQPSSQLPTLTTEVADNIHTAPNRLETPRKRRYSLPDHLTTSHSSPQISFTPPIRRHSFTSSSTLTATPTLKNTLQMSNEAVFSGQKVPITSETVYTTSNEVQAVSETQETEAVAIHDDEHAGMSRHAISSLERRDTLQNFVRRSRSHTTPSSTPQKPATMSATSTTSTTFPTSGISFHSSSTTLPNHTASPSVTTASGTSSTMTSLTPNHTKSPKTLISEGFNWADDTYSPTTAPTIPTKHPRDFSNLRSSTANPFSSLKRRCRYRRNQYRRPSQLQQKHHYHPQYYHPLLHYSPPHCLPSQPPLAVSLDWDQDPRLTDLSNALRALGWVRR